MYHCCCFGLLSARCWQGCWCYSCFQVQHLQDLLSAQPAMSQQESCCLAIPSSLPGRCLAVTDHFSHHGCGSTAAIHVIHCWPPVAGRDTDTGLRQRQQSAVQQYEYCRVPAAEPCVLLLPVFAQRSQYCTIVQSMAVVHHCAAAVPTATAAACMLRCSPRRCLVQ